MGRVNSGLVLLMPAYSAVFMGKMIFGKPTVIGTLLGSLFLSLCLNAFTLMAMPYYISGLITAIILIGAIGLSEEVNTKAVRETFHMLSKSKTKKGVV